MSSEAVIPNNSVQCSSVLSKFMAIISIKRNNLYCILSYLHDKTVVCLCKLDMFKSMGRGISWNFERFFCLLIYLYCIMFFFF